MKTLISKITTVILILMVVLSIQTNIYAHTNTNTIQSSTQDNKPSGYYGYYGIVQGNGHTTNIYIKIANNWERYTTTSDYIGYECKIISFNNKINLDNYKSLRVINIIDAPNNNKANNTIHDYMLFKVYKSINQQ